MMPVLKVTLTPPMKYSAASIININISHSKQYTEHTECSREILKKCVRPMQDLLDQHHTCIHMLQLKNLQAYSPSFSTNRT